MNNFIYKQLSKKIKSNSNKNFIAKNCIVAMNKNAINKINNFFITNKNAMPLFKRHFIEYLKENNFFNNNEMFILKTEYNSNRNTFRIKGIGNKELLQEFYKNNENLQQLQQETKEQNTKDYCRITGDEISIQKIIKCTRKYYNLYDDIKNNPFSEFLFDNEKVTWYQNQNGTWTCDLSYYDKKYIQEIKFILENSNLDKGVSLEEIKFRDGKIITEIFGNKDILPDDLTSMNEEEIYDVIEEFIINYIQEEKEKKIQKAQKLQEEIQKAEEIINKKYQQKELSNILTMQQ